MADESMWSDDPRLGPLLRRLPGPDPVVVRGCSFRVTEIALYENGWELRWQLSPAPDLTDVEIGADFDAQNPPPTALRPGFASDWQETRRDVERMRLFLGQPSIEDDIGSTFTVVATGFGTVTGGWDGRIQLQPAIEENRKAVLRLAGAAIPLVFSRKDGSDLDAW